MLRLFVSLESLFVAAPLQILILLAVDILQVGCRQHRPDAVCFLEIHTRNLQSQAVSSPIIVLSGGLSISANPGIPPTFLRYWIRFWGASTSSCTIAICDSCTSYKVMCLYDLACDLMHGLQVHVRFHVLWLHIRFQLIIGCKLQVDMRYQLTAVCVWDVDVLISMC